MTLIELLITLAVGAVLLVVAVPNLNTFVKNNRIVSSTNDFIAAVNIARTEAIRRGVTVVMCRTTQPLAATPSCNRSGSTANDWSTGWLMYATDGDINERDYASATDELIRVGQATGGSVELTSDTQGNQWLAINRDGTLREADTAAYAVCDDRGYDYGRLIRINLTGRAQVAYTTSDAATDCTPN